MIVQCFLFLFINPILLINLYQAVKEKIGRLVKRDPKSFKVLQMIKAQKYLKEMLVQCHKIHLGK